MNIFMISVYANQGKGSINELEKKYAIAVLFMNIYDYNLRQ